MENKKNDSFLCGGNSEDPLNLEGLSTSGNFTKRNKKLRFLHNKDPVIIPSILNVKNPLNLDLNINSLDEPPVTTKVIKVESNNVLSKSLIDPIVSPVINFRLNRHNKRKRNSSENSDKVSNIWPLSEGTKNQSKNVKVKNNNTNYIYGNYPSYYNYRNSNNTNSEYIDPRIKIIHKHWIENKRILDIGCNIGLVTKYIAKFLKPLRVTGLDIDNNLIKRAKFNVLRDLEANKHIKKRPSLMHSPSRLHLYPPYSTENMGYFPYNLEYMTANYVCECQELLDMQTPEYDVVFFLSVSKWIHLNWGDDGLKHTFQRIYNQLHDNSLFIFEPQEWASYKKAKKKNKQKFDHLQFRPQHFKSYLLNDIGFSYVKAFYPEKSTTAGFDRTIYVYLKSTISNVEAKVKELNLEGGEYKSPSITIINHDQ